MLTKREHNIIEIVIYLSATIFVIPISWNKRKCFNKATTINSKWKMICFIFSLALLFCHSVYLIIRFVPGFGYKQSDFKSIHLSMILHTIFMITAAIIFVVQVTTLFYSEELSAFINQLLSFNKIQGKPY